MPAVLNGTRRFLTRNALVCAAALAALLLVPLAKADTTPIPANVGLPWTDPNHRGPLELLASQIASHIAGRTVAARCYGDNDWNTITQQRGLDPNAELGYVEGPYDSLSRLFLRDPDGTELSPTVCLALQQYAIAPVKPTKCQRMITETTTKYVTKRVLVKVRLRVHGTWVTKKVWKKKTVPVTIDRQVPGPAIPCYLGHQRPAADEPDSFWTDYWNYTLAMLALAHESIHLAEIHMGGSVDGYNPVGETHANCYGLQWVPYVATMLGASPDDAHAIGEYASDYVYPSYHDVVGSAGSPYWSEDCRENGPLDRSPNDGVWP